MTFSIIARDEEAGTMGGAVQSHFPGVGRDVAFAKSGVGVTAVQAFGEPGCGRVALTMLEQGLGPNVVLNRLLVGRPDASGTQLAVMDADGTCSAYVGADCYPVAEQSGRTGVTAQGNMLARAGTTDAMVSAFQAVQGDLADRLLAALEAAQAHGGDVRGQQSACLLVVPETANLDRQVLYDQRVEDSPTPIAELRRQVVLQRAYAHLDVIFEPGTVYGESLSPEVADRALESIARAAAAMPDEPEPLLWQAIVLARAGRPGAEEAQRRALELNPGLGTLLDRLRSGGFLSPHSNRHARFASDS